MTTSNNALLYPVIDVAATGRNIRALRKAQGLTVSDVQLFLGMDAPQAIYQWQSGKCLPTVDNLYALSALFGVSINEILVPCPPTKPHTVEKSPQTIFQTLKNWLLCMTVRGSNV